MKNIKELKADNGYYLTQVGEVGENRVYLTAIKGINIVESDWRIATQEEKEQWEKENNQPIEEVVDEEIE